MCHICIFFLRLHIFEMVESDVFKCFVCILLQKNPMNLWTYMNEPATFAIVLCWAFLRDSYYSVCLFAAFIFSKVTRISRVKVVYLSARVHSSFNAQTQKMPVFFILLKVLKYFTITIFTCQFCAWKNIRVFKETNKRRLNNYNIKCSTFNIIYIIFAVY
jgi:hypothetical protein